MHGLGVQHCAWSWNEYNTVNVHGVQHCVWSWSATLCTTLVLEYNTVHMVME